MFPLERLNKETDERHTNSPRFFFTDIYESFSMHPIHWYLTQVVTFFLSLLLECGAISNMITWVP